MSEEILHVEDLLRHVSLFQGLDNRQISVLVDRLELIPLDRKEILFSEGDPGDSMYIVFRGEVLVTRGTGEAERILHTLTSGDTFGEEAMLYGRPRTATVSAAEPSVLLRIDSTLYAHLLQENPQFLPNVETSAESHQLAREVTFPWLGAGEAVHLVARKHRALLWLALFGPFLLLVLSAPIFFMAYLTGTSTPAIVGGLAVTLGFIWGLWNAIDWGNDYYIVTNQRVIWLERVVGLYESRQEAPLRTVLSVGMESDQVGRILGYGDVIVRTYPGRIVMRNVGHPQQFASLIEEYWMRTRKRQEETEAEAMVRALRDHLGLPLEEDETRVEDIEVPSEYQPSFVNLLLANYFKLRYEEGSVITYRKHWFILVTSIWQPTLALALVGMFDISWVFGYFRFLSLTSVLVVSIALYMVLGIWWMYVFIDWRNDIYQLTADHIVDIDRRPLGSEEKRSAPLENILSLRHERIGIWGLLFNFGTVTARIGKAAFTFDSVHNPAQVQQDIFARMDERQNQKREIDAARERARMAEWLAAYHRNVEDFRQEEATRTDEE